MTALLAVADLLMSAVMLLVLVGAGGFCALLLPDVWRGRG